MIIYFDEKGYNFIEVKETSDSKIAIILSSKDGESANKTVVNSIEISKEKFSELISELNL